MQSHLTSTGLKLALGRLARCTTLDSIADRMTGVRYCLQDAAAYIHDDNKQRGWWTDLSNGKPLQRNIGELLMLAVSELAEVPCGNACLSDMDDKLPDRLMFEVELADCAIRIFDMVGALAQSFYVGFLHAATTTPGVDNGTSPHQDVDLMQIVRDLADAMEGHRKRETVSITLLDAPEVNIPSFDYNLGVALHGLFHLARRNGLELPGAICEKLEFNAKRADHKVENRRAAGGKAY